MVLPFIVVYRIDPHAPVGYQLTIKTEFSIIDFRGRVAIHSGVTKSKRTIKGERPPFIVLLRLELSLGVKVGNF